MVILYCQTKFRELQWQIQVMVRLYDESLHDLSRDWHTQLLKNRDFGIGA